MKWMKLLGISFFVCLFFTNCQKEEIIPIEKEIFPRSEPQMVPFKITGGTIGVFYGGTDCFVNGDTYFGTIPQVTYITGTATHIGLVDATKSYIEFLSCQLDLTTGIIMVGEEVLVKNKKGDGLKFSGVIPVNFNTKIGEGRLVIVDGYGKFEGASGWVDIVGNYDQESDDHGKFSGEGEVTQSNQ